MPVIELSARQMAEAFGLEVPSVTRLAREGKFIRRGRDRYDLLASIKAYVPPLRDAAAGRGGADGVASLSAERARLAAAQASVQELKLAQMRGEFLPADEVASAWSGLIAAARSMLLTVSSRMQERLGLNSTDTAELDAEIRAALSALAKDTPNDSNP